MRLELREISLGLFAEIGQLFDRDPARAALVAGGKSLGDQPRAGCGGDPPGLDQRLVAQRPSAQKQASPWGLRRP